MPRPADLSALGVSLPGAVPTHRFRLPSRFKDVRAAISGPLPRVVVGQVYADLDPRSKGREVQVLKVGGDGKVTVRTVAERTCDPRTPSLIRKSTLGSVTRISQRRFQDNSRGFRLLRQTTVRSTQAYLLATRLAAACGMDTTEMELRAADALIGLLGRGDAEDFVADLARAGSLERIWGQEGVEGLLCAAARSVGDSTLMAWESKRLASASVTRSVSRLV